MTSVVPIQGSHILLDIFDGNSEKLNDALFILESLKSAAEAAGATVLKSEYVKFPVEGVTAFHILSESHISIHTWPSESFASIDIYTCGNTDVEKAIPVLLKCFDVTKYNVKKIERGMLS